MSGDGAEEGSQERQWARLSPNEGGLGLCSGPEEPADPWTPQAREPKNPPFLSP